MSAFRKFDPSAYFQDHAPTPAKAANPAKEEGNFSGISSFSGAAPVRTEAGLAAFANLAAPPPEAEKSAPRKWAEGYARLCVMPRPAGFPAAAWSNLVDAGGRFIDRFSAQAAALGWNATDIFGCHPVKPFERIDMAGFLLLMPAGAEVAAITADTVTIKTATGGTLRNFRRSRLGAIAAWELDIGAAI